MKYDSQFQYETNDLVGFTFEDASPAALIALLLAIENEHPGTLSWCVRQAAMIDDNFIMRSRSSRPDKSILAQKECIDWMRRFDEAVNKQNLKEGGMSYARN